VAEEVTEKIGVETVNLVGGPKDGTTCHAACRDNTIMRVVSICLIYKRTGPKEFTYVEGKIE